MDDFWTNTLYRNNSKIVGDTQECPSPHSSAFPAFLSLFLFPSVYLILFPFSIFFVFVVLRELLVREEEKEFPVEGFIVLRCLREGKGEAGDGRKGRLEKKKK